MRAREVYMKKADYSKYSTEELKKELYNASSKEALGANIIKSSIPITLLSAAVMLTGFATSAMTLAFIAIGITMIGFIGSVFGFMTMTKNADKVCNIQAEQANRAIEALKSQENVSSKSYETETSSKVENTTNTESTFVDDKQDDYTL